MVKEFRFDTKLLLISLVFLAVALISLGLTLTDIIKADIGFLIAPFFLIYLVLFTLFLHYNHELEKDEYEEEKGFKIQNPYKISLYFGIFLLLVGIIGNLIEFNFILMALLWGGVFAIVYSIAGWHDLRTDGSNSV